MLLKLSFIFLTFSLIDSSPTKPNPKIFHGALASKGQFPWQVGLYITRNTGLTFCGGSIISERWILTAAHCLYNAFYRVRVLIGTTQSTGNDPEQLEMHATEWFLEGYDPWSYEDDIAVIKLPEDLVFNDYIQPIALASQEAKDNISVTVSGWGDTDGSGARSSDLRYTNLTINTDCAKTTVGTLCAVPYPDNGSQNICGGDSGGPLIVNASTSPLHIGIVSTYQGCQAGKPAWFTSTAFYRDWIREVTNV